MCTHDPRCPTAEADDRDSARTVARHHEQGWVRLCNGVILFDDGGSLFGRESTPRHDATPVSPVHQRAHAGLSSAAA